MWVSGGKTTVGGIKAMILRMLGKVSMLYIVGEWGQNYGGWNQGYDSSNVRQSFKPTAYRGTKGEKINNKKCSTHYYCW